MANFVVYTAIAGNYDLLKPAPAIWRDEADLVAFVDGHPGNSQWLTRPVYRRFKDPCRNAKIHKVLPHRYFPEAEYSLWLDGSIVVKTQLSLNHLAATYLGQHDIALFKHFQRNCIYLEALVCLKGLRDDPAKINRQMAQYHAEGYPKRNGLAECSVILRRHTKRVNEFNEAWYAEIRRHSRRDQLSFDYIAHKLGVGYAVFPGTLPNNPYFIRLGHNRPTAQW